jgi:aquaporin Z
MTALSPSASIGEALRRHWREYLMEGAEIAVLMLSTCICGTLLYSRDSPLKGADLSRTLRSILMGAAVAITTFLIIRSPFGRRTGAHFNPAVTLAFYWLGRVHRWDAMGYILTQFGGGIAGVLAARRVVGIRLAGPPVSYMVTLPGSHGNSAAFLGEFLLAALLMGVVLNASNHRLLVRFSPLFVALVTVCYYGFSSSISGFSVNPARSFSSALFAWVWQGIWIYFLAPCLGMLAAAALYIRRAGRDGVHCAKVFHDLHSTCPFTCHFLRMYPEA